MTDKLIDIVVCGAHMQGLPLNIQLTDRGAVFRESVKTADCYRFYALPGGPPFRPGLVRMTNNSNQNGGGNIEAEIWGLPAERWGDFIALIPSPLVIGSVLLADGRTVKGFLCESFANEGAADITELGSWRAFLAGDQ
jgi:allophanate hydrolase